MANDVPAKLCEYLAENPRLSFFVTPDVHFTDQYGNDLKIERWIAKRKTADGAFQHTYIEFDARMRDFVHAQSSRWFQTEDELEDLSPQYFVRTVTYYEPPNERVLLYVRNEEQIGDALDVNYGEGVSCMDQQCKCLTF